MSIVDKEQFENLARVMQELIQDTSLRFEPRNSASVKSQSLKWHPDKLHSGKTTLLKQEKEKQVPLKFERAQNLVPVKSKPGKKAW